MATGIYFADFVMEISSKAKVTLQYAQNIWACHKTEKCPADYNITSLLELILRKPTTSEA